MPNQQITLDTIENAYKIIYDLYEEGVVIVDVETRRYVYANQAMCNLIGYTFDEITSVKVGELTSGNNRIYTQEEFTKHTLGLKNYSDGLVINKKDGTLVNLSIKSNIITIEGRKYAIGILKDATAQTVATKRLRTLVRAINQSTNIMMITNEKEEIIYVNTKFTQTTGYTAKEVLGKNPKILSSGKTTPVTYLKIKQHLKQKKEWRGEFINRRKDGTVYWELATITPVYEPDGELVGYVKVADNFNEYRGTILNFWNVLDLAQFYVLILDSNLEIKMCNSILTKALGYVLQEEVWGHRWTDYLGSVANLTFTSLYKTMSLKEEGEVVEFASEFIGNKGNIFLVKWFSNKIDHDLNWIISIGIPYHPIVATDETEEVLRNRFKEILNTDKLKFSSIRQLMQDSDESKEKK